MGLYDNYRLSNSSLVPTFQGSTAPELLQVGAHLQNLYDVARTGAGELGSAVDNLQSMDQDIALRNELRDNISSKIGEYSKAKDWENRVEDVRSLGRQYASRSAELLAPMQQFSAYQKSLDDKEMDLRPEQKAILLARSKAGYKGLKKDNSGRYIGQFNGISPAKNVDMTKWADDIMKGMEAFKGGQVIEYADGKGYLVKKGNKTEWVSEDRVQSALDSALRMDGNVQSYMNMEGENAEYIASNIPFEAIPNNGLKKYAEEQSIATGIPPNEIYGQLVKQSTQQNLIANTSKYLRSKYAFKRTETEQGLSADSSFWEQKKENEKNANGLFGDVVADVGIDITRRFGTPDSIVEAQTQASTGIDAATTELMALRQNIARSYGKPESAVTDDMVRDYYSTNDPTGAGKYNALKQSIQANQSTVDELNQVRTEAMNLASKKKTGKTFTELKNAATANLASAITKDNVSLPLGGGKVLDKNTVKDYEMIDSKDGVSITIRNKETGQVKVIRTKTSYRSDSSLENNDKDVYGAQYDALKPLSKTYSGIDWKSSYKEAASNIRSNSMWMPLQNKTTPDGQSTKAGAYAMRVNGILRAGSGGLNIKDADLNDMDSDDQQDMKARIGAGKFDVLGVGKIASDGKIYVKLSVEADKSADDPAEQYKTIVVGVNTNVANKLSQAAIAAGERDGDVRTYQLGHALAPNSGYEQVMNMGTAGRLTVKRSGAGMYEIVPNITGSNSDAVTYEVYKLSPDGIRVGKATIPGTNDELNFNDAFDLGVFLDRLRGEGATIEKKNK